MSSNLTYDKLGPQLFTSYSGWCSYPRQHLIKAHFFGILLQEEPSCSLKYFIVDSNPSSKLTLGSQSSIFFARIILG